MYTRKVVRTPQIVCRTALQCCLSPCLKACMWCVCGMRLRCLSGRKTFAEYNAAAAMNSSVSANSRWWCVPSTWPRTDFDATTATTATTASAPTAGLSISTPGLVQVKKAQFNAKTSQKADKSQKVVPIKSVFIHRLLLQRHVAAPPKKNIPVEEPSLEGTKEVVVAELQLLASDTLSGVTYNTERVMCLLKVTFQDHCQHYVTLCEVISWEKISSRQLCAEAQLRFESTVDELEVRLKKAAQVFSEQQGQDTSLVQISRHLQGSLDHFLITEHLSIGNEFMCVLHYLQQYKLLRLMCIHTRTSLGYMEAPKLRSSL
ncbi:hypothetical protein V5799_009622 [Amblyomma americanum]|uniref:Uncharacterized protein n=1 Tax=Amblyomma americanum TaxID=6943 RepID=A0AAQ4FB53_AMBAM